jgi:predicted Zn finger-like uncharacterized protein
MNVRCPSCRTVFRVDPAKVPEAGVRARCASCAGTIDVRRDGTGSRAPAVEAVRPPAPPAQAPPAPVEAPPPPRAPRLSQPFAGPRPPIEAVRPAAAPPAAAPPASRPSAPVFRPTPGQPVIAPPTPPVRPEAPRPPAPPPPARAVPPAAAAPAAPPAPPLRPPVAPERSAPRPAPSPPTGTTAPRPVNPFLQQDPRQKARRLARALVSDMIVYQPAKRQRALAAGTLKQEFDEEIQKSWEEYVEQVGEEMATSTPFWREALNEILAGGKVIF